MLHLHRSERADALVAALAGLLVVPGDDPFGREVVSVPTRGIERWVTQRLSGVLGASDGRGDGVCANVEFPSPYDVVRDAVAAASGVDPDEDPWRPERMTWPLLEVVDAAIDEPWLAMLRDHLEGDVRAARRFGAVRQLAEHFDRYARYRPELVLGWAQSEQDSHWQAELWRRTRDKIGTPSPAERTRAACEQIASDRALLGELPHRLSSFGLTRLPAAHVEVLRAIAQQRDVHLFLLHPSPALWKRLAGEPHRAIRRADDATAALPANRLLRSWGRDARELQLVLGHGDAQDHHHAATRETGTLLARLQDAIRDDQPPPPAKKRPRLQSGDRSVEVHACHGRARQTEVLRDALLHLLADDPTLEPRDVIVMCPDVEAFAPLIHATFGASEREATDGDADHPDLRVRLADRSIRQTNPVLGVVSQLLELADERLTASQVLDLADREPVRRRFRFDDDDLSRVEQWISTSGIRWGLDAPHRRPFKLDAIAAGTFRQGLDRLLLGVTIAEDPQHLYASTLPLDDVDSGAIDLAGRFAELIDRLHTVTDALTQEQPIAQWAGAIAHAADALTATTDRDAWQRAQLQRLLDDLTDEAQGNATPLALGEIRTLLADRLRGRPTRANFRTGHLTVCTLMPMRSVPHRVVCLLGLDDGVFPRNAPRDGDDLTLDDPHVGERDPRSEDRQLLLDALMAAEERLIVTYTGNDERTNAPKPPAVPVGELLDAIDRTVQADDGRPAREHVEVRHPLQPFDPANFTPGALTGDRPWSFDRVTLAGARALTAPRHRPGRFLDAPLPPLDDAIVELDDLVRFVRHPVRAFLKRRLGISLGDFSTEIEDALPVALDHLERWGVGERMLEARLGGCDAVAAYRAEIARGLLPPDRLAQQLVRELVDDVDAVHRAAHELLGDVAPRSEDVRAELGDVTVRGTVADLCGDTLRAVTFSRVGARPRLEAWVRMLVLSAAHPDRAFEAVVVGRARRGATHADTTIVRIGPQPDARAHLEALLGLYHAGMREPLPMAAKTSAAYAEAAYHRRDPLRPGRGEWESQYEQDREDKELEHQLVHGGVVSFDELLQEPPRDDESGRGWDVSEHTRFGRLARRLWDPLLDAEDVTDR